MIDTVSHYARSDEMAKRTSNTSKKRESPREEHYADNSAVRELLDHVAEELAREYVRLMKEAASEEDQQEEE
jgi:hypothetical protein